MIPLLLPFLLAADPTPAAARWEFHDSVTYAGRSRVTYRPVELADRPVPPIHRDDQPAGQAHYGVLQIGNRPADQPLLIWIPNAPGGPQVWIDADGDGRFQPNERHPFSGSSLEVNLPMTLAVGDQVRRQPREALLRRKSSGDGLSYAVRGFVLGQLNLGGQVYKAMLTDHDADGCFDRPGIDRIWIDLDRDGSFDPLTEQFALGTPLSVGGKTYLIQPSADGSTVQVRERPQARGTLRLELAAPSGIKPSQLTAQLVSDWGELVTVNKAAEAVSLPTGRYAIEALTCQLPDARGRTWSYRFAGERRFLLVVEEKKEVVWRLLEGLMLQVRHTGRPQGIASGETIEVSPTLRTVAGLELVNAEYAEHPGTDPMGASADIHLMGPDGQVADRASSGFQ